MTPQVISDFNLMSPEDRLKTVKILSAAIIQTEKNDPGSSYPNTAKHHFSGNLYAREYLLGAGVLALGRKHKTDHIAVVARGDVSVISESGWVRLQAGAVLTTKAGAQRIVFGHEETVFVTIHEGKSDADDIEIDDPKKMMDVLADDNSEEILEFVLNLGRDTACLSQSQQS